MNLLAGLEHVEPRGIEVKVGTAVLLERKVDRVERILKDLNRFLFGVNNNSRGRVVLQHLFVKLNELGHVARINVPLFRPVPNTNSLECRFEGNPYVDKDLNASCEVYHTFGVSLRCI